MAPWGRPSISLSSPLTQISSSKHWRHHRKISLSLISLSMQTVTAVWGFFCLGVQLDEIEEFLMNSIYKANHWPGKLNEALGNPEKAQFSEREIWKRTNIYNWVNMRLFFTGSDILPKFHVPDLPFQKNNEILISLTHPSPLQHFSPPNLTLSLQNHPWSQLSHTHIILGNWLKGKLQQDLDLQGSQG